MLDLIRLAVADHHVGVPGQDRRHQLRDVGAAVLVVGIGVHDDVGAELQRSVEPGLEGRRQTLVVGQAHDVADAARPGHLDGPVRRAVIDHEPLDLVDALDRPGQVGESLRKRLLLVEARDLDDELHG